MVVLGPEFGSLDPCPCCFPKAKTAEKKTGWVKTLGVEKVGSCTHINFLKRGTVTHSKRNIKVHFREEKKIERALHGVTALWLNVETKIQKVICDMIPFKCHHFYLKGMQVSFIPSFFLTPTSFRHSNSTI